MGEYMDRQKLYATIKRAQEGIYQYLEIMDLFPSVNVAENKKFQFKYRAFYMREATNLPEGWYKEYFSIMEDGRKTKITFYDVLSRLHEVSKKILVDKKDRVDASFSSKLVHTLDTTKPILDQFVYRNTGIGPPTYNREDRLRPARSVYEEIEKWYKDFLPTHDGQLVIECFNQRVKENYKISDLRKVDFVLWKWRQEPFIIADGGEI